MSARRALLSGGSFATLALLVALVVPLTTSADRLAIPGGPTFASTGNELVAFDGFVYFAANDGVKGNELWRTDGTEAGTTLVQDFNVGNASSNGNPRNLTVVGNRMFLTATNADSPVAIFTIDKGGTPQATTVSGGQPATGGTLIGAVDGKALLVHYDSQSDKLYSLGQTGSAFAQITTGNMNVDGSGSATLGGYAYYAQTSGPNSATEPWRTNGTTAEPVKDVMPGVNGSGPREFVATGNRVYFRADDGFHGLELWVTDGTDAGTQLVHEHHPSTASTAIDVRAASGNTLFYVPDDPTTGGELWRTDGTDAGTRVVKDITPGPAGSGQTQLFTFGAGVGMLRGSDVYVSDGTDAGTTLLGSVDGDGLGPAFPRVAGTQAYFRGGRSPYGSVIWRTDGTAAGTFALTAGAFDGATPGNPDAGPIAQLGTKLIFTGLYRHAVGDPVPASARRIFVIDTAQADETRRATTAPSISGTAAAGQALTGDKGAWTLEPNAYTYAWLRDGTAIPNATTTTYTPSSADAGAQLKFRVTAAGIGGPNVVSADSAAVTVAGGTVVSPAPTASPTPTTTPALTVRKPAKLTGAVRQGKRITLRLPTFAEPGVRFAFRWFADGKRIKKQSRSSLKLKRALKGKRISAKITVTKPGYGTLVLTVGPTAKVKAG